MRKSATVAVLSLMAACAWLVLGCSGAKEPKQLSSEEAYQRLVGRWVNPKYPGTLDFSQVTVIRPDYVGEDWLFPESKSAAGEWTIKIKKTWVDEKGYTYVQSYNTRIKPEDKHGHAAALMRVDRKRKVWECVVKPFNPTDRPAEDNTVYPERINPELRWYWIYYRK